MKILAADVCDCYLHTKDTDPKKEECMIGDFTIVSVSTRANERAVVLGEVQKYNLFFSDEKMRKRVDNFIMQHPQFQNYNPQEYKHYLSQTLNIMIADFKRLNTRTNGDCSVFFKP